MADLNENVLALFEMKRIQEPTVDEAKKFCSSNKVGDYLCSVKTRYGWCCDLCLEEELLALYSKGIHTINSCCGHGNEALKTILVVGENSRQKMEENGYGFVSDLGNGVTMWKAKSITISQLSVETQPPKGE